jgi:hypothetical protein
MVETRRDVRRMRASAMIATTQTFVATFAVIWIVGVLPLPGYEAIWAQPGAYEFGQVFATGGAKARTDVLGTVRGVGGVLVLLVLYGTTLKVLTDTQDREAFVLASSPRAVAVGVALANAAFLGLLIGPAILAGALAFAVGAGLPLLVLSIPLAGVLVLVVTAAVGAVCALSARALFGGSTTSRTSKVVIATPLAAGYFGLFLRFRRASELLSISPLGWVGDLALVPAGPPVTPVSALGALAVGSAVAGGASSVLGHLAERVWLHTERTDSEQTGTGPMFDAGVSLADRLCSRPTAAVARALWLRVRREPRALVYTMLPIAITISIGLELAVRRPAALPMIVAVYGSIAVGMGPSLNPLGNDGPRLSLTLSTPGGSTALLRGYVVAGALPGSVAVATVTLLVGLGIGAGLVVLLGTVVLGVWLATVAVVASLGIGVALPEYEGIGPTSNSTIRSPRLEATGALFVVMALVGLPALVGPFWRHTLAAGSTLDPPTVAVLGVGLTGATGVLVSVTCYYYAARILDSYQVDR